jgi:hypothetical protein
VLEKGEVSLSGDAAELARDEAFVKGSYLGESAVETTTENGAAELRLDGDDNDQPPLSARLLETIEDRAAQEGRDATEVLLDLLRKAMESPAEHGNGNGGAS